MHAAGAIDQIPGIPVRCGSAHYVIGANGSMERDRATSQVYLLWAGPVSGHFNRLAAQIKKRITARVERDAFEFREGRKLIDGEGAAANKRHHIGASPAGKTVSRSERRRCRVD